MHASLSDALLDWAATAGRDLPWRRTRDPWAVLVSEVMLQQTQVARVAPRYQGFLEAFPTVDACAAAPLSDVVRAWAGLGYNRRARDLHAAAVAVVDRHGGVFPSDLGALLALPGIGPYTARAVLAFAFERDVGVVDVNAARVLARAFAGRALTAREVQVAADTAVPVGHGWSWNQAVLDLGATVCVKRDPRCATCPVGSWCAWRRAGGSDPAIGSAATGSTQSPFVNSDRQGRGRLVEALRRGPVPAPDLPAACGWPADPPRAERAAESLVRDGLVIRDRTGTLSLPSSLGTHGDRP